MVTWLTMRDAAKKLGKSQPTISRLAAKGVIQVKEDPTDKRVRLVDLEELQRLYSLRSRG